MSADLHHIITREREIPDSRLLLSFSSLHGRIGIFGGSFDPVHNGHLHVARTALQSGFEHIVFIPAAQNPLKNEAPTSEVQRLEMLLIATKNQPTRNLWVSPLELLRGGISYMVETISEIQMQVAPDAELALIVGSDSLSHLHQWRDINRIFELTPVVVVPREDRKSRHDWGIFFDTLPLNESNRNTLKKHLIEAPAVQVSSTELRQEMHRGAQKADAIPDAVLDYIRRCGLYGEHSPDR